MSNERTDFKAYGPDGSLRLHVWTASPGNYAAERGAFRARLNRGELLYVDVLRPGEVSERMFPVTPPGSPSS